MRKKAEQPSLQGTHDPDTYRAMSEPFKDINEANTALQAFQTELRELRKKHRMADVTFVIRVALTTKDGGEGDAVIHGHIGNTLECEAMLAFALGKEQLHRQERMSKLLSSDGAIRGFR